MKPIIEYQDYRQYILDYYKERKQEAKFTWRQFAALAGYASGSYLKLVCDGKTRLTAEGAAQVATAMKLVGFKFRYFVLMVEYDNAKDSSQKEAFFQEMVSLGMKHRVHVIDDDIYSYFESWKNPVLRELAPSMPGASFKKMAEQCLQHVDAQEVADTLDFLLRHGLVVKDKKGVYHQTGKSISTGDIENVPATLKCMHRQMGQLALQALDGMPESERHFSGITLGIPKNVYGKIETELAKCRRRIIAIATESDETEQIYRLNLQMFPLTKLIEK